MAASIHLLSYSEPVHDRLKGDVRASGADTPRTAVVLPSVRAVEAFRRAVDDGAGGAPGLGPYLYAQEDFLARIRRPPEKPFPSPIQRRDLLRQAMLESREDLAPLFGSDRPRFLDDFLAFAAVGDRLLRFFDELCVEQIPLTDLRHRAVYTDFERHVAVLAAIWNTYRRLLDREGFRDRADWKRAAALRPAMLEAFDDVRVVLSGFPPRSEVVLLAEAAGLVDLSLYISHEGPLPRPLEKIFETFGLAPPATPPLRPASGARTVVRAMPDPVTQAGFVGWAVADARRSGIPDDRIAVVLPDDAFADILIAVLGRPALDVAMGFPLSASPLYGLLEAIRTLLDTVTKDGWDARVLVAFATHPFIRNVASDDGPLAPDAAALLHDWKGGALLRVDETRLSARPALRSEIRRIEEAFGSARSLQEGARAAAGYLTGLEKRWTPDFAKRLRRDPDIRSARETLLEQLAQIAAGRPTDRTDNGDGDASGRLLAVLQGARYPAVNREGTIRLLGLLETRSLTFDAVIVPDMNEGLLPRRNPKDMFLNTSLRDVLGLPTPEDREALYGIYLDQLLGGARRVYLSYVDDPERGLRSRFLEKILHGRNAETDRPSRSAVRGTVLPARGAPPPPEPVAKSAPVMAALTALTLSASSLRTWLACPYRFYLRYLCRLDPGAWPEPGLTPLLRGTIFHEAARRFYAGPEPPTLRTAEAHHRAFAEALRRTALADDRIRLVPASRFALENWLKRLQAFSEHEVALHREGWRVVETERAIEREHPAGVHLRGVIDRIDRRNGRLRLIDYKTGSLRAAAKGYLLGDEPEAFTEIQLPFYLLIYCLETGRDPADIEGLYYYDLKTRYRIENRHPDFGGGDRRDYLRRFEERLDALIREIRDPDKSFTHTDDPRHCRYCPFGLMCRVDERRTA